MKGHFEERGGEKRVDAYQQKRKGRKKRI